MDKQKEFYNELGNWNFENINYEEVKITNWDLYEELKKSCNSDTKILDLGTGGGEKLLKYFPDVKEIVGTDFSKEMICTANDNLIKSGRNNITFRTMDNLKMDTPNNYFDIVVARHTCINPEQIYKTLKNNGKLIIQGVDKYDCWNLKLLFNNGQAFTDDKSIGIVDYENIIKAGFKKAELIPIYIKEYYKTKDDLIALLLKTPILLNFSKESLDFDLLDKYIEEHKTDKGILLQRKYYGIVAIKEEK